MQTNLVPMFDMLMDLTEVQRTAAKARLHSLLTEYNYRCILYSLLFYTLRTTATIGGIVVTALLSVNETPFIKWLTWGLSLATTTSTAILVLYKLEKRFFMLHGVRERLRTEAWQFLTLAGRYSGHFAATADAVATHANQFAFYTTSIEKIRMRHINEEFIRAAAEAEDTKPGSSSSAGSSTGSSTGGSAAVKGSPTTAVPDIPARGEFLSAVEIPTPPHLVGKSDHVIVVVGESGGDSGSESNKKTATGTATTD